MKTLLLLAVMLLSCGMCQASNPTNQILLVSTLKKGGDIFINYVDEYHNVKFIDFERDTLSGELRDVKIKINHPVRLAFNFNTVQYPVFAYPGDTIYVTTNQESGSYYTFNSSPNKNSRINFLMELERKGCGIGYPDAVGLDLELNNYANRVSYLMRKLKQRLVILDEYAQLNQLEADCYTYFQVLIQEQYIQAISTPYWKSADKYVLYPPDYNSVINKSPIRKLLKLDEMILSSVAHRAMIMSYVRFTSRASLHTPEEFPVMYRNAADSLTGKARDYALFYLMRESMSANLNASEARYRSFKTDCASAEYCSYIDSLRTKAELLKFSPAALNVQLETETGEKITWAEVLRRNKGSIVYLDVWASWCIPCRAEMPHSKKLQESMVKKRVNFVYISIDSNKGKWLEVMRKDSLMNSKSQHYLLDKNSALASYLNASSVPQYVILNKSGVPVSLNATRPDNPTTALSLLGFLNNE